jgi:DNA repair exonuclease SbcCD ATPase subunit
MATKKQVELEEETMEKSSVFISNEKELLKRIVLLEAENVLLPQLKEEIVSLKKEILSVKKSSEEIAANEHSVRKELEKLQVESGANKKLIEAKDNQIELLKADLSRLANLFDEYIVAYQDQVKMLGVFVKNTQTIEKYLSVKINEFNGGDKK